MREGGRTRGQWRAQAPDIVWMQAFVAKEARRLCLPNRGFLFLAAAPRVCRVVLHTAVAHVAGMCLALVAPLWHTWSACALPLCVRACRCWRGPPAASAARPARARLRRPPPPRPPDVLPPATNQAPPAEPTAQEAAAAAAQRARARARAGAAGAGAAARRSGAPTRRRTRIMTWTSAMRWGAGGSGLRC